MFFTNNTNASNYKIYLNFVKTNSKHICDVLIGETKLSDDWTIVGNNYKKLFSKKNNVFVTIKLSWIIVPLAIIIGVLIPTTFFNQKHLCWFEYFLFSKQSEEKAWFVKNKTNKLKK